MYLGAQLPCSDEHLAFARQKGVTRSSACVRLSKQTG
jgi:hypothetical protein